MSYRLTKGITRSTLSKKGISWLDSPSVSTSVPVSWKNLTEISLTGNKLDNGDFSNYVGGVEHVINGTFEHNPALAGLWESRDVGSPETQGTATHGFGKFAVLGAGNIGDNADNFHYAHLPLSSSAEIVAKVVSQTGGDTWAKAGVMMRETLAEGSKTAHMVLSQNNGSSFSYRAVDDGGTSQSNWTAGASAPYWVKLVRDIHSFTGYVSSDGSNWVQIGTQNIAMDGSAYMGLCVSSDGTNPSSVVFEDVTANGQSIRSGWEVSSGVPELISDNAAEGLKGEAGPVSVLQDINISAGRYLVVPTRLDSDSGDIKISFDNPVNWSGSGLSTAKMITLNGSALFEIEEGSTAPTTLTLSTEHADRHVGELSVINEKIFDKWEYDGVYTYDADLLDQGILGQDGGGDIQIKQPVSLPAGDYVFSWSPSFGDSADMQVRLNPGNNLVNVAPDTKITLSSNGSQGMHLVLKGSQRVNSVLLHQTIVSGGTMQTYTGGGIEKISGVSGYNAGASSVQFIGGNSDGYVQFQVAQADRSIKVGLVYADSDFGVDQPHLMNLGGDGGIDVYNPFSNNLISYSAGDWFRIRHYAESNQIKFQRRLPLGYNLIGSWYDPSTFYYLDITMTDTPNMNYHVSEDGGSSIYYIKVFDDGSLGWYSDDATSVLSSQGSYNPTSKRITWSDLNVNWEFQDSSEPEDLGHDYVTFHTSTQTTSGEDLFFDASFFSVGAKLNDVQILT